MTPLEVAWLAGLLEGEGSFSAAQNNRPPSPRTPRVCVAMTDEDVIARVASLLGKRYYPKNVRPTDLGTPRKPQWQTVIYGAEAVALMRTVRPLMGARRTARIDELIAEWYAARPHLKEVA